MQFMVGEGFVPWLFDNNLWAIRYYPFKYLFLPAKKASFWISSLENFISARNILVLHTWNSIFPRHLEYKQIRVALLVQMSRSLSFC